ncbi:MAG: thioredoxin family protein [Bacteroidales bacterium]|nr:thioredoxin family protein [Bacteroidales bacterium]
MKFLKIFFFILLFPLFTLSQTANWEINYQTSGKNEFKIIFDIEIPQDFHLYSFDQVEGGPIAAKINFELPDGIKKKGNLQILSEQPQEFFDEIFEINIRQFSNKTRWSQTFVVTKNIDATEIKGTYSYQLCKDDGYCLNPFPEEFSVAIPAFIIESKENNTVTPKENPVIETKDSTIKENEEQTTNPDTIVVIDTASTEKQISQTTEIPQENRSLAMIFILGFLGGLLAFLTPCVFPMVPMTVSMFLKRDKKHALRDVIIYGLSIILIFVSLGLCITLLFGVDALNKLSTAPAFNMVFFIIFVVFAISFFGVFELMLPTSWINYFDQKADNSKGFLSIFFMAFTLVLVSFSCTAMIIGTLLVESVVSGSITGPMIGMLGFSTALSLPFIVFAAIPSLLSSLAKSGEWMNDVKISLGFIELAFALKFISKADLVAGWGILPRDLFIAIWILLLVLWGLSILRIIRIGHSSKKKITKPRLAISFIIFATALYLIPGFLGKPIDSISGWLPPMSTQKINLWNTEEVQTQTEKKYGTLFHSPYGINGFYDYEEGVAYAKKENKPILLDFTGLGCENCRKIEMNVWAKPEILQIIKDEYVLISLYLDSREPLDSTLARKEVYGDKTYNITTLGEHWSIFMMKNYHGLMQPYYVLLSTDGEKLCEPIGYDQAKNIETYKEFLLTGLKNFNKIKK